MLDIMLVGLSENDETMFRSDRYFSDNFSLATFPDLISALKKVVECSDCFLFIDFDNKDVERVFTFGNSEGIKNIKHIAVMTKNDSLRNIREIKRNYINRIFLKPLDINLIKKSLEPFLEDQNYYPCYE